MKKREIKEIVKSTYGKIAKGSAQCGCSCDESNSKEFAKSIGYSDEELNVIPEEANLALSCGNPVALASLKENEVVLDLGSGAGFDCFLAANKVGPLGKVIGIDMTQEMVERAIENAKKNGISNVEFRIGEIENLPVDDNSIDVVISNCVINLSDDKAKVFKEIYRVLKPGGRIAISDMALLKKLPKKIHDNIAAYVGCVSGAILVDEYKRIVESAGLKNVKITVKNSSACLNSNSSVSLDASILDCLEKNESLADYVVSIYVEGFK
jgi:SAM-dependent methyltransferase